MRMAKTRRKSVAIAVLAGLAHQVTDGFPVGRGVIADRRLGGGDPDPFCHGVAVFLVAVAQTTPARARERFMR